MALDTPQFRMADAIAGGNLTDIIAAAVKSGVSAEDLSRQLYADHRITVSGQTLRRWIRLLAKPEVAA